MGSAWHGRACAANVSSDLQSQNCVEDAGFCFFCQNSCPTEVSKLMNANFPLFSKSRLFKDEMTSLQHPPLEEEVEGFKQEKQPLCSCEGSRVPLESAPMSARGSLTTARASVGCEGCSTSARAVLRTHGLQVTSQRAV